MTADDKWAKGYAAGKASTQGELSWLRDENKRLTGTMRYIAAQAKAGHVGALRVIQSNAEAALSDQHQQMMRTIADHVGGKP